MLGHGNMCSAEGMQRIEESEVQWDLAATKVVVWAMCSELEALVLRVVGFGGVLSGGMWWCCKYWCLMVLQVVGLVVLQMMVWVNMCVRCWVYGWMGVCGGRLAVAISLGESASDNNDVYFFFDDICGYREPMLQIRGMHTLIRDQDISKHDFVFYSDRLIRLVVEHGLGHLPFTEKQVVTPTGSVYTGVDFCKKLCGVSIVRRLDDVTLAQLLLPPIPARQ
ncbi:hypothetical protein RJ640_024833 [Escallonia rubra]|uniref:Phosphoribosyltransferase domain-containing protein n=1 Tax=Escallonia rubra TaxID=112253 RepID=A0AA88S005_9ASTE|nr:hypothetical protein RJ640_024833 [Escallonia rubra]